MIEAILMGVAGALFVIGIVVIAEALGGRWS